MAKKIIDSEEFIGKDGKKYYLWVNYEFLANPHKCICEHNKKIKDCIKINIPSGQTPQQTAEIIKQKIT